MIGFLSEVFVSFQGEGAHVGERHLFVRLAGCNLRCRYCDTPGSLERHPVWRWHEPSSGRVEERQNPVPVNELSQLVAYCRERDRALQMLALTGGEPLLQAKFLRALLAQGHLALPVLLETNGVLPDQLALVLPGVRVISMDIKLPSNSGERAFWDQHRAFLKLAKQCECYVKVLVDEQTSPDEVEAAAALVHEEAPAAPMFLQPIVDPEGRLCIRTETLSALFSLAYRRHAQVRVLPQMHKFLRIP
ncbi:MAG: 7-carboxy-7-deazaguanine synthase QueE [Candidatus Binatia bacterium]|nr:7-carboxy-7-deazaguanine synthase QueE [Candidatus Binatia bacterium]